MVWRRQIFDLSGKDLAQSKIFVQRVRSFKIEHLASVTSYAFPGGGGNIRIGDMTLEDFFSYQGDRHMELDFGSPGDSITIFSTFSKGPVNFYLMEMLGMEHESGVLDAYQGAYGIPLNEYVVRGKV